MKMYSSSTMRKLELISSRNSIDSSSAKNGGGADGEAAAWSFLVQELSWLFPLFCLNLKPNLHITNMERHKRGP